MSADVSFDLSPAAACIDEAFAVVGGLDGVALDVALVDADRLARRLDALRSAVIGRAVETDRCKVDGHRRVGGWVAARTKMGRLDAGTQGRVGRALASMPRLRAAFESGVVSFAVVEMITRRFFDDRVAERLMAEDGTLTEFATGRCADDVRRAMTGWDRMADPAGADDAAAGAHRRRRVRIVRKNGEVHVHGRFGAAQGEELAAVLDRFEQAEFAKDAAESVDGELPRTAGQRSADALAAAMRTADRWLEHDETTCSGCGSEMPAPKPAREPLTNLVFDEESLRQWVSGEPEGPIDVDRLRDWAAGTSDGNPVPPDAIVRSMILGAVRIVVRRADGVITSVGRKQRLFRGRQRDAVVLQAVRCVWPGCTVAASRCEADHLDPHAHGGATASDNGGPCCDFHNRWRADHHYRTVRDERGDWHVLRPDGTDITGRPTSRPRGRDGPGAA